MTSQHVRVEGTSYQRGQQYGSQAAARVRRSVQAYQQAFAHFAGWDWDTVRREAARFEAPVGELRPTARRLWLAAGHPCQVPHQPLDIVL
jgi:Mn-dependent DtxR family transcriptional regulator